MSVYDSELTINGEAVRSPEQQVYKNMKDIKKLKEQINSIKNYSFDGFIISDIGIFDIIKDFKRFNK